MGQKQSPGELAREVAGRAGIKRALTWVERAETLLADETVRITEIPAPTFGEAARAAYIAERFRALGLAEVELAVDGNVYGLLPGTDPAAAPAVAVFAHLDTVFGPDVPVTVTRREGRLFAPGVGDNAAGVAGVLGALQAMQAAGVQPQSPIWIVGTVGEEGLGDLIGARSATDRLAGLRAVVAVEGSFFGRVSHTAVGSRRLRVIMRGPGGHSWHDFGRPSAVHALMRAGAALARMPVPAEPRTTVKIGEVRGGSGVNVIAEQAECIVDLRSMDAGQLDTLTTRVRRVLDEARGDGVEVLVTEVGNRPAGSLSPAHPLVLTCVSVLDVLGMGPAYAAASTDANVPLGRGIPAVTLGVTRGGGAHTRGEWIEIAPLVRGVQQLVLLLITLGDPRSTLAAS
jgi:acetylornithine deacetylase/succinyl-diaminopimelate desuccinylase-like protein